MKYDFPIKSKEFSSCNILEAKVGSNCPCGGDGGHGGITYMGISDIAGTCWNIRIKERDDTEYSFSYPKSIEIELLGDTENTTFIQALDFALKELLMMYATESQKNKF